LNSLEEFCHPTKKKLREKDIEIQTNEFYSAPRRIFVHELASMFSSGPLTTNSPDVYKRLLSKYNPSIYDPKNFGIGGPPEYLISIGHRKRELKEAVKTADACLTWRQVKYAIEDEGTINMVLRRDREISGYERMFLMTTREGEPVLAIDNLEVERKNFDKHTDSIKAMALGAIQLGLGCNVKYVVGEDARVKYGPRQAYGNKSKEVHLTQINIPSMAPHYRIRQEHIGTVYVLMEN